MHVHQHEKSLKIAVLVTFVFFGVELAGGFLTGSLALISDAGHMLVDGSALLLSLGAVVVARSLPTRSRTFGYHRIEVMVALVNGLVLIGLCFLIAQEAVGRLFSPAPVYSTGMLVVGLAGLSVNIFLVWLLHGSPDLNIRSAFIHVLGDTLSSIGVVGAAAWIALTGQVLADPLISLAIVIVILATSLLMVRDCMVILLQFAPRDVDFEQMVQDILNVEGVEGVHNIHLWTLCSHINVLDAHVYSCEEDPRRIASIRSEIRDRLARYNIHHSTLEFECEECPDCRIVRDLAHPAPENPPANH
ncbi:MAG TPA: cation diffusion facilitator family transporter [Methanolinea sp.]|nr:cation diffusion facilitator family transporter [Methanolinea sp.]HRS93005.1 cation diffusion facilitator family transporter [Methanolinea sp.]